MMRGMKRNFYKYNRTPSKVVLGNFSILGFHDNSVGKESTCNAGDRGLIPEWGRSAGEGLGYPRQYSWDSLVAQLVKKICL